MGVWIISTSGLLRVMPTFLPEGHLVGRGFSGEGAHESDFGLGSVLTNLTVLASPFWKTGGVMNVIGAT